MIVDINLNILVPLNKEYFIERPNKILVIKRKTK